MLLCMIHMYFLIACTPHVLLLGCLGSILSHDPNQFVGHIGFFQISDLCIRKLQFHGLYRAVDMMQLCAPTTGAVTFVSSQAREISVMDTPCFPASSATRSMMR